jgi:hypothetical protein
VIQLVPPRGKNAKLVTRLDIMLVAADLRSRRTEEEK